MEVKDSSAPNIYTGLEDDQHASRGKVKIEEGWNKLSASVEFPEKLRILDIDESVARQASESLKNGEHEMVIVDVGSGKKGVFVDSFHNPALYPKLHAFLKDNRGFNVRIVGVTSAEAGGEQGLSIGKRETIIGEGEEEKSGIVSENFAFTITRSQPLRNLLGKIGVDKINIAFSTFGVGYLTPANFEQCLTNVADKLALEGSFFGIQWNWVPAGLGRTDYGGMLYVRGERPFEHPLAKVFGDYIDDEEKGKRFEEMNFTDKVGSYLETLDFCIKKDLISPEEAANFIRKIDIGSPYSFVKYYDEWVQEADKRNVAKIISKFGNFQNLFAFFESLWGPKDKVKSATYHQIEEKFVEPKRQQAIKQLDEFKTSIEGLTWEEVAERIRGLDPLTVSEFWDWDVLTHHLRESVFDKMGQKTTLQKQQVLDKLGTRPDLECYFNEANFYIWKKHENQ